MINFFKKIFLKQKTLDEIAETISTESLKEYNNRDSKDTRPLSVIVDEQVWELKSLTPKEKIKLIEIINETSYNKYFGYKKEVFYTDGEVNLLWEIFQEQYPSFQKIFQESKNDMKFLDMFKDYVSVAGDTKTISDLKLIEYALKKIETGYFSDWVKKVDIDDKKLASSLWYFEKVGILEKKKEKNRVFFKRTNLPLITILESDYVKLEDFEQWDKRHVEQLLEKFSDDNEKYIEIRLISKNNNSNITDFLQDFFGANGIYPKNLVPVLPTKDYGKFSYTNHYAMKNHSNNKLKEYREYLKKHSIITLEELIKKTKG